MFQAKGVVIWSHEQVRSSDCLLTNRLESYRRECERPVSVLITVAQTRVPAEEMENRLVREARPSMTPEELGRNVIR